MSKRINFGKLRDVLDVPDLIGLQIDSYKNFLQRETPPDKRKNQGLQAVFKEIFPIRSINNKLQIDFVSYDIEGGNESRGDLIECLKDGKSYEAKLMVNLRVESEGASEIKPVFFGNLPMMTEAGTFVINGAERVIVSQLHRSPGICFAKTVSSNNKSAYEFRFIPDRGSWLDVQIDHNNLIYMYIDRRRRRSKALITSFFRVLGYETDRDILDIMYGVKKYKISALRKESDLSRYYTVGPVFAPGTQDSIDLGGKDNVVQLSTASLAALESYNVKEIELAFVPEKEDFIVNCIHKDVQQGIRDRNTALCDFYRHVRSGQPESVKNAEVMVNQLFFDPRRYDLGEVGRFKINERLKHNVPLDKHVLDAMDFIEATKMLIRQYQSGVTDDIDHLGARRVRTVGELLQTQCRSALLRMERTIRERMTDENIDLSKLVNPKLFGSNIKDFFARSSLSQFMDQINPLSELTNKRRLSALGPGGLSRDRAGFEVRDVHSSHYGRICPIETPEGPNIGLISSLSLYAVIDKYGFISTPYRKIIDGKVSNKIEYLTADREEQYVIAQANAPLDENGCFIREMVMCRCGGESEERRREEVQLMDVSPKQLVSAAAGIIPFLEHDDANRALMGANMQRQAVPLLMPEAPLVGTGLEERIAKDSRAVIVARRAGIVAEVVSDHIIITADGKMPADGAPESEYDYYRLFKYMRSNAGTCVNQRPICSRGQKIKAGEVIADGASTQGGELALGRNVRVAYMSWCGYNYEDAIIVSERLVKEDVYTSIHIDSFDVQARETRLGTETITCDIPNASKEALAQLDEEGIIREGAEVSPGDYLVGKVTPKGEVDLSPEQRLLHQIFQDSAKEVKDSSLILDSGKEGIVIDIRREYQQDVKADKRSKSSKTAVSEDIKEVLDDLADELFKELGNKKLQGPVFDRSTGESGAILIKAGGKFSKANAKKLASSYKYWDAKSSMDDCDQKKIIDEIMRKYISQIRDIEQENSRWGESFAAGGPVKKVKVYVGCKRKLQVGDKMAGRHGNKGIVSRIVPVEDMPFLADGTPVDIILNPLGVPSRMNVGQVFETHLGWAANMLGIKVATPVFDGVTEEQIVEMMKKGNAEFARKEGCDYHWGFKQEANGEWVYDGKTDVYDGRTGKRFDQRVMVGNVYMLKLDHLVANKIHARAVGPYSLVTQQPLGGKAQHGGQRFGEMEVWALEAYGAAYTLQEMLTVKSDDTTGRTNIYNSIVRGHNVLEPGRPESFNVILKEMQSLGLDIRTVKNHNDK